MKWYLLVAVLLFTGCAKRQEQQVTSTFQPRDSEYVLAVVIDLSGSFAEMMADDGKAHAFLLYVLDRYFRDRIGTNDRVVLSQISSSGKSLLWDGTPTQLRREFPTPEQFRDFLLARSVPDGSFVHESLADTLEYIMSDPNIVAGTAKPAMFVLSDMVDTGQKTANLKQRLLGSLAKYAQLGGVVGLYFVDEHRLFAWRRILQEAGMRDCIVESQIVSSPTLPQFE